MILLPVGVLLFFLALWLVLPRRVERSQWHALDAIVSFIYSADGPVDEEKLIKNVNNAFAALVTYGPWGRSDVWAALNGMKIGITTGKFACVMVLGENTVTVDTQLAFLCHAMAHLTETRVDKLPDYEHSSWMARGLRSATQIYEQTRL